MTRRIESIDIAGPAGRLEALYEAPHDREPWCAAVVCHPHPQFGGTLHNKVVYRIARGLRRAGVAVLRFNYRGVGRSQGAYGDLDGEIEDARAVLGWLRARHPELPHALAGFSFGARVIMRLGCEMGEARYLLACGFPTAMGGAEFLEHCAVEKVFLQSTHDQYGPRAELDAAYARWAEPKRIEWIEAADHFFSGALDALEERVERVAAELSVVGC
jgi:alpha/beta superfamily hydrolase